MRETVGRYRIVRPLGRGAMGLVFLAEDPSLSRQVAIKMLDVLADSQSDRDFLRTRLLRDAKAAAILSHPNIVSVHDIIEDGDSVYVVMEYIDGESLASYLDKTPLPDQDFVLRILRQAAAALDYTHGRGIVHRDIKPANIMIGTSGVAKILDFGIARINDTRTTTPTGMVMGTVDYMAPEQVKAEMIDGRADQFSLAAVAYRMIAGNTLFGRHTLATLAYKLVNEAPQPVHEQNSAVPPEVDRVLSVALAKSPSDRYPTCTAFADALAKAFAGVPAVAAPEALPAPPPPRRSKVPAILAAATLLAAGGGFAIWKLNSPKPVPDAATAAPAVTNTAPPPPVEKVKLPASELPSTPVPKKVVATVPPKTSNPPVAKPPDEEPPPPPVETTVDVAEAMPAPLPPSSPAANVTFMKKGEDAMQAKDYQEAIRNFSQAIEAHPKLALAFANRALAYQMSSQWQKAIQDDSDAIRLGARDPHVWGNRGICELRMHQDDLALADFNRALELNKNLPVVLNGRGSILARRHQYRPAIDDFTAAIRLRPKYINAYQHRAAARKAVGDNFGAADDYATIQKLQRK